MVTRVLEWFRDTVRGNTEDSDNRHTLKDQDVPALQRFLNGALEGVEQGVSGVFGVQAGEVFGRFQQALSGADSSVDGVQRALSSWVAEEISPVLDLANIDRSSAQDSVLGASLTSELGIFDRDAERARNGASVASSIVVALNIAAAAADGGTQILSLGQIQGFQQLVQNLIWGTGLADVGGLAFRPQVAASFAPLLERYWNSQSQAQIPGTQDVIRFLVREVFDPDRRKELEAENIPDGFEEIMTQRGFSRFWTESYWAAHWSTLTTTQLNEFVHRGVISEDEWRRQQVFNDFLPRNLDWLQGILYEPFTRVDARRMADMGLLTDEELLQAYADIGYFAPRSSGNDGRFRAQFVPDAEFDATVHKAQALVIFTRVFNTLPDIRRRLRNGFLRPDEVEPDIRALGVPQGTARRLTETLVKAEQLGQAEATRELTTSAIVRGAKANLISFQQGRFLLERIGWDSTRAEFMLRLRLAPEDAPTATDLGRALIANE